MKKIVDAIFETDETQDAALRIVSRDERATLRQIRSYWSDDTNQGLSGVSETDIATLSSEDLRKRVADFWGEEFVERADRLSLRA